MLPATPALVAALALLGGCASLEWQKAGAAPEIRDRDIAECTADARSEAQRRVPLARIQGPKIMIDQQGRTAAVQHPVQNEERFSLEQALLRQCMTRRGYTLESATPQVKPDAQLR